MAMKRKIACPEFIEGSLANNHKFTIPPKAGPFSSVNFRVLKPLQ